MTKAERKIDEKVAPVVKKCFTQKESFDPNSEVNTDEKPQDPYANVEWSKATRKRVMTLCDERLAIDDDEKRKAACDCFLEKAEEAGTYSDVLLWFKNERVEDMYAADYRRREQITMATRNCLRQQ